MNLNNMAWSDPVGPIGPLLPRSESGLKTHSILPSLLQTARRQGVHPRKFLQTLLTADIATAQADVSMAGG